MTKRESNTHIERIGKYKLRRQIEKKEEELMSEKGSSESF